MSDLISRQAAIDALNQIFDRCEEIEAHLPKGDPDRTGYKMYPDYMIVWKYLHQLPSVEPERKIGRWITDDEYIDCSVCRREKWSRVPYENLVKGFRYCPKCGAYMRGDENETD